MKKLLTTLLAVCLVFTNAGFFNEMLSYAETTYITKAEFYNANVPLKDVTLSTDPDNVQLCSYTDLVKSPLLKLYAGGSSLEGYYVRISHRNNASADYDVIPTATMPFQNKGTAEAPNIYAGVSFSTKRLPYVAVGSKHSFKIEILGQDKQLISSAPVYYFDLIRSVELDTLTATDGNGQALVVTKQAGAKQYNISCTDNTLKLTCTAKTPKYAKITVDDAEVKSGAETTVDLTKYTENDAGQKVIPIAVEYIGAEGTGEGTAYKIVVDKQDYTPQVETTYSGAEAKAGDYGVSGVVKAMDPDKDAAITMQVNAVAPEGSSLTYQWYAERDKVAGYTAEAIQNATESSYTIPTKYQDTTIYYCKVSNTVSGAVFTAESEHCMVRVQPTYASEAEILSQSDQAELLQGQTGYKLSIAAKAKDLSGILSYQWYVSEKNEAKDGTPIQNGGNGASVLVDASKVGTFYYYCVVTNTLTTTNGETKSNSDTVSRPIKVEVKAASNFFEGNGSKEAPFLIKTAQDFVRIKEFVAKGNSFADTYFKIAPESEGKSIELPSGWDMIGTLREGTRITDNGINVLPFSGNLDGDGCILVIPDGGKPLFRYVRDAHISNLNISGTKIDGAGLINEYFVDYGEDGNYASGVPDTVTIDHVTLLSGSSTKYSGFIHGNASGKNNIYITNSVVEKNVTIGYDGKESQIGSFAGCLNGNIISCKSAAEVYGVSQVGGIAGEKGQSMGACSVLNCQFTGEVHATGNYAGGILGSGYDGKGTAPNTPVVTIRNCVVRGSVEGKSNVGGILGGEPGCEDCWGNGAGSVVDNLFCGTVKGNDENAVVGAIVGFLKSYNENQSVASNYFIDTCGAKNGIGAVEIQHDTNFDISKTGSGVSDTDAKSATMLDRLNASSSSYKNWVKGADGYPDHSEVPVLYAIELSGNYKTMYNTGDAFSTANMVITGKLSDGTTQNISLNDPKLKFTGFDSNKRAVQTITVTYGVAKTTYDVTVLYKESQVKEIVAYFTLLGDSYHKEATANDGPHTLSKGNLQTWVSQTKVTINNNTTVYDVFKKVLNDNGITWKESSKLGTVYIESLTRNGVTLGEFDNGNLSGWMYTLNGTHPDLGVAQQFLEKGDRIVFHYTDDYTKEEGSDKWGVPGADEVKNVTTSGAAGSATTKAPTEVKVSGTTAAATVKAENQSEILKQAAEKKSAEIILEVSKADSKGADSVQLSLDVTFVKNVADKTNADLTVNTENGKVTLDQETLKTIIGEAKGNTVIIEITKVTKPTEVQKKAAGANGHLLKLTIKSGDKVISDFNKGKVKVVAEIVSKLLDKKVAAIHIADDGKIEQLAGKVLTIGGKKYYEFTTPHFSTFALVDADELGLEVKEEPAVDVKTLTAKLTPVARSAKTAKKNVKVTTSLDKQDKAIVQELKDAGYTVKYRFYRSTKKAAGYKAAVTKKTSTYTNTGGKKGTKYYYKVQVRVYDADGKLAAKTALKQCKYASRTWTKGK